MEDNVGIGVEAGVTVKVEAGWVELDRAVGAEVVVRGTVVDDAVEEADEHATVTTDKTAARIMYALSGIMFLRFIFMITSFLYNMKNLMFLSVSFSLL